MKTFTLICIFLTSHLAIAQQSADAQAKQILEALTKNIQGKSDLTYAFALTIEYPESEPEVIEGTYYQKEKNYRLETPTHYFISDGESKWVVDVAGKEIQIHDHIESSGAEITDPQALLNIYQNPHFDYRLAFDGSSGGRTVQIIEFKPSESGGDMSKANLVIDATSHQIDRIEVFNRDGTRLYLDIKSIVTDSGIGPDQFSVDGDQFAGYHTEDLRIE